MKNNKEDEKAKLFSKVNIKCFACGKMVPDDGYVAPYENKDQLFCTKDCYDFYLDYKKFREREGV